MILRENALAQLNDSLARLWAMRTEFGDAFAECINMFQAILNDRSVSDFDDRKLVAIQTAVFKMLEEADLDDVVANDVTVSLLNGGLDVFRELE